MAKAEIIKQLKEEAGLASLAQAENAYNTLFSQLSHTCISNSCCHRSHDSNKRVHITYKVDGWLNHK